MCWKQGVKVTVAHAQFFAVCRAEQGVKLGLGEQQSQKVSREKKKNDILNSYSKTATESDAFVLLEPGDL